MSDATTISTGPGETWQPTGEMRWLYRVPRLDLTGLPDDVRAELEAAYPGAVIRWPHNLPLPKAAEPKTILQQRWASNTGADEWRDVPTVEG